MKGRQLGIKGQNLKKEREITPAKSYTIHIKRWSTKSQT